MQVITFGCRVNAFETAVIKQLTDNRLDDIILIQTCAVTAEAERQCRQTIRQTARKNPNKRIIVAGCAAQLHPEVFAHMPEVFRVLGNYEKISPDILFSEEKVQVNILKTSPKIPLLHHFDGRDRAFLQIQQGCDHACTFCIVHTLRGKNTGLKPDEVINQATLFTQKGFREIVLTGIDVASYPYGLYKLTKRLLTEVPDLDRLRFGSLDPACIGDDFLDLLAKHKNFMPSFHLSIQAGDNLILKRMGRRHTFEQVLTFAKNLRKVNPIATLGADFITGFPTETEAQFQRTLDLIEQAQITHAHIFPYSARTGTPAAKMPQISKDIRTKRALRARELSHSIYQKWLDKMLGKEVSVLIEHDGRGYTENYFPVRMTHPHTAGKIITATTIGKDSDELVI